MRSFMGSRRDGAGSFSYSSRKDRSPNFAYSTRERTHIALRTSSAGYFDDPEALIDAAEAITDAKGIYFIPNPVNPDLLARAHNRTRDVRNEPTTSDSDIEERHWLLVDLDPVRPSGISSSDEEHDRAIARAQVIRERLREIG